MGHIPGLDGLRGLALIGVLLFHANAALAGGYLGVDLFFVLSGYLITSLLLAEHEATHTIDFRAFWIRRARRLFPALLSLMPAIALYARFCANPSRVATIRGDALATLAYVANWRAVLSHKTYWALFASPSPLEHTWSLSIEEQFYVVWPVLIWFVLRRSKRAFVPIIVALGALSMFSMVAWYAPGHTTHSYYGTDARATAILAGALLAATMHPSTRLAAAKLHALDALGFAALGGLGVAWWTLKGKSGFLYHGGFWLTELACVILVACAVVGSRGILARFLSLRPLRWVGTVSYGAYLWHWPIDVVVVEGRVHLHGLALQALRFALTFAIAAVSYRWFEAPIRRRGVPHAVLVVPSAIAVAVVALLVGTRARELSQPAPFAVQPTPDQIRFRIVMFGDSTANSLGWALRGERNPYVSVALRGLDGYNLLYDTKHVTWTYDESKDHFDAAIVFLGGAFLYGVNDGWHYRRACTPKWDAVFESGFAKRLAGLAKQKTEVWVATIPQPLGPYDNASFRKQAGCINGMLRKLAAAVPRVRVLDLAGMLCPGGKCVREHDGHLVRPDGVHYDMQGAKEFGRQVLARVAPAEMAAAP